MNKAPYSIVGEIDFTSPKSKRKKLESKIDDSNELTQNEVKQKPTVPPPTTEEISSFYNKISNVVQRPAILSLVEPFSERFVPRALTPMFPMLLMKLHNVRTYGLSYKELVEHCSTLTTNVTEEGIQKVEEATREQAKSKNWFQFKAGRISSSTIKSCCRTNISNPSKSLIKKICYPEQYLFSTQAAQWSCNHKKVARDAYHEVVIGKHTNFQIKDCGFVISKEFPFLGVSPDGLTSCSCLAKAAWKLNAHFV